MKYFKKIMTLIMVFVMLICSAACSDSYENAVIYFETPSLPLTLDPQTASTNEELIIVNNIFEGLLRKNESGAIVGGLSESFEKNNLTYTFKLRKKAAWSDETPLTADDFVFAFKRAVSPETKAPFASRLFAIENAKDIYNGKKSIDTLGVKAKNKSTLVITLSTPDENFEETLTSSIAMPCNEEFFYSAAGKYGLSKDTTLSCGSYRLAKWNKESFGIRLYTNDAYNGTFTPKNGAIYISKDKEKSPIERLTSGDSDISFIDSSLTPEAESAGLKTSNFQNICWFLTISNDFSDGIRKALGQLTGNQVFANSLKSGYTAADSLYPSAVKSDVGSVGMTFYDIDTAKATFANEIKKLPDEKFPAGTKLYYYDNSVIKPVVTDIVGHWQNHLGAFVNIEPTDNLEVISGELKNQTLSLALFPVRADSNNLAEYLSSFGFNYTGQALTDIQTELLKSHNIFPLIFQNTTIAYSPNLNDVFPHLGGGYIDFSFIVKTEK